MIDKYFAGIDRMKFDQRLFKKNAFWEHQFSVLILGGAQKQSKSDKKSLLNPTFF